MNLSNARANRLSGLAALPAALLAALLACGPVGSPTSPSIAPTATTPPTEAQPREPTPTEPKETATGTEAEVTLPEPEPTPPAETVAPPVPSGSLSADGPWWVLATHKDGIWAVNPDGSGLTRISDGNVLNYHESYGGAAPSGGHLAFITATSSLYDLVLHILSLPDGATTSIALTTPETTLDPAEAIAGEPLFEAALAVADSASFAWSPDGRQLAFMGMIEGPTSDLYVYSLDDGRITRLTSGPSQAYAPSWSPDGKYIVHAGASSFGTGAGYSMEGVWAAAADGSGVKLLYEPDLSGNEIILGWLDAATVVVHTWDAGCGNKKLRAINVVSGQERVLWDGYFSGVAADPVGGTLVLAVGKYAAGCSGSQSGIFIMEGGSLAPWRMLEDEVHTLHWSPVGNVFFADTEFGPVVISSTGEYLDLARPASTDGLPIPSQGADKLAWIGSELWVGSLLSSIENPPRLVFNSPVDHATWSFDAQHLLFTGEGGLYVAREPEMAPVLIGPMAAVNTTVWVWP